MTGRGRRSWGVALLIAGTMCVASGAADAAPPAGARSGVLVIRPPSEEALLQEASLRIRSELEASGTSSQLIDCSTAGMPTAPNCGDSSAAARISLSREEGIATIQVTASLPDGLELRRHVRVPPESGGGDPSVLAVRAVELLRDIYLDIPRVERKPEPVPAASPRASPAPSVAPPPQVVQGRAFLGGALLQGRWGLGAATAPAFGFGVTLYSRLSIVIGVAGPFHERVGSTAEGMAETWQTLGALQLRYEIGAGRLRPFAAAGMGLYAMRVRGEPQPSEEMQVGLSRAKLAPLVTAGLGLIVKIFPWLAATIEAHEIVTWPLDIMSGKNVLGRAGGPSELLQAGLIVWAP